MWGSLHWTPGVRRAGPGKWCGGTAQQVHRLRWGSKQQLRSLYRNSYWEVWNFNQREKWTGNEKDREAWHYLQRSWSYKSWTSSWPNWTEQQQQEKEKWGGTEECLAVSVVRVCALSFGSHVCVHEHGYLSLEAVFVAVVIVLGWFVERLWRGRGDQMAEWFINQG